MTAAADIRAFVVFEPSYGLGCIAALSSLARHASQPVAVDMLMRSEYADKAEGVIKLLKQKYGEKILINPVHVPQDILQKCDAFTFREHFIPEVLFRLYYFDMVDIPCRYVVHIDLDMMFLSDFFALREDLSDGPLLHVVEAKMTQASRDVMPPHITRYINAGFLVYDARDRAAINKALRETQDAVRQIAGKALYLDQDAINMVFYDRMKYIPRKWNHNEHKVAPDTVVLHATGTRKPWFFRGGHPFTKWYEAEMEWLGVPFLQRYNFVWPVKAGMRKIKRYFPG